MSAPKSTQVNQRNSGGGYDDFKSIADAKPLLNLGAKAPREPSYENIFLSAAADEPKDWPLFQKIEHEAWGPSASFFAIFAIGVYAVRYWRRLWELPWVENRPWTVRAPLAVIACLGIAWMFWQMAVHYYAFAMLYPLMGWTGRIIVHTLIITTFPAALLLGYMFSLGEPRAKRSAMGLEGNAEWASLEDIDRVSSEAKEKGGVWLGDVKGHPVISPYHTLTGAPTRSGKGVGVITENLLDYPGSVVVNDVKGENYFITRRERRKLGRVWLIDPFYHARGLDPTVRGASTNWVGRINPYEPGAVTKAGTIAEAVVIPPEGGGGENKFFIDNAYLIIRGLILWAAQLEPPHNNILTVREILTQPVEQMEQTMKLIQEKGVEPARAAAAVFWSTPEKARATIQAECNTHLGFLDDSRMADALKETTIPWERMKSETHTVYIVIPPDLITQASRFIRLVFGQAIAEQMTMDSAVYNVLYLLDEFPQMGYFKQIEDSIAVVAGYGITLWLIIQNLGQLVNTYPKWETFLANAAQHYYRPNEYDTAEKINKLLGRYSVYYQSASINARAGLLGTGDGGSASLQFTGRDLMTTDEIMNTKKSIIKLVGEKPILADRFQYFKDSRWKDRADPNPFRNKRIKKLEPMEYPDDDEQPTQT